MRRRRDAPTGRRPLPSTKIVKPRDAIRESLSEIAKLAQEVARHPDALDDVQVLEREAELLTASVNSLVQIIDQHEALTIWTSTYFSELSAESAAALSKLGPYDPGGLVDLSTALSSAFSIGGRVIDDPSRKRRFERALASMRQAQTASARRARQMKSQQLDIMIVSEAERIIAEQPSLGNAKIAGAIAAKWKETKSEERLDASAIEKRLRRLRPMARPHKSRQRGSRRA